MLKQTIIRVRGGVSNSLTEVNEKLTDGYRVKSVVMMGKDCDYLLEKADIVIDGDGNVHENNDESKTKTKTKTKTKAKNVNEDGDK